MFFAFLVKKISPHNIYNPKPIGVSAAKKPVYFQLPYMGKSSFEIKRQLKTIISDSTLIFNFDLFSLQNLLLVPFSDSKINNPLSCFPLLFMNTNADSVRLAILVEQGSNWKLEFPNTGAVPPERTGY